MSVYPPRDADPTPNPVYHSPETRLMLGGSLIPGANVAITGSVTAGMLSIVCGAVLAPAL